MDWMEVVMGVATIIGGGAGIAALLRTRGQNAKDKADARKADADAERTDAEAEVVRVNAYAALWEHVKKITDEYDRKLASESACYQAGIEKVRTELLSDIEAKDIRIGQLEAVVWRNKDEIARLNTESIDLRRINNEFRAAWESAINVALIYHGQLLAAAITPAAELPKKPPTGPLR